MATELKGWMQNEIDGQRSKTRTPCPEFEAVFHPVGALSAVVQELAKHPVLLIILLPALYKATQGPAGLSTFWIYLPTLAMFALPILAAAIKCFTSKFSCRLGRLFVTTDFLGKETREIPIRDLRSVQLIQDSLGRRFGYGSLQLLGNGIHQRIDGLKNAVEIQASLEPILDERKESYVAPRQVPKA